MGALVEDGRQSRCGPEQDLVEDYYEEFLRVYDERYQPFVISTTRAVQLRVPISTFRFLFEQPGIYSNTHPIRSWDISPDGQRFLMVEGDERMIKTRGVTEMILVQNWFEELKRLMPRSK